MTLSRHNRWLRSAVVVCMLGSTLLPLHFAIFAQEESSQDKSAAKSELKIVGESGKKTGKTNTDKKESAKSGSSKATASPTDRDDRRRKLWADVDARRNRISGKPRVSGKPADPKKLSQNPAKVRQNERTAPKRVTVGTAPTDPNKKDGEPSPSVDPNPQSPPAAQSILRQPTRIFNKYSGAGAQQSVRPTPQQEGGTKAQDAPKDDETKNGETKNGETKDGETKDGETKNGETNNSTSTLSRPRPMVQRRPSGPAPLRNNTVTAVPLQPRGQPITPPATASRDDSPAIQLKPDTGPLLVVADEPRSPRPIKTNDSARQVDNRDARPTNARPNNVRPNSVRPANADTVKLQEPPSQGLGGVVPSAPDLTLGSAGSKNELVLTDSVPKEPAAEEPSTDTKVVFTVTDDGIESIEVPRDNKADKSPTLLADAGGRPRPIVESVEPAPPKPMPNRSGAPIKAVKPIDFNRNRPNTLATNSEPTDSEPTDSESTDNVPQESTADARTAESRTADSGTAESETGDSEKGDSGTNEETLADNSAGSDVAKPKGPPEIASVDPPRQDTGSPVIIPGKVLRRPDLIARSTDETGSSRRKRPDTERPSVYNTDDSEDLVNLDSDSKNRIVLQTPGTLLQPKSVQSPNSRTRPRPQVASVGEQPKLVGTPKEPTSSASPSNEPNSDVVNSDVVTSKPENAIANSAVGNIISLNPDTKVTQAPKETVVTSDVKPNGEPNEPTVTHHRLQLQVKQSGLLRLPREVEKVEVVNGELCEAILFENREVSIIAKSEGRTHVMLTMKGDQASTNYLIAVTAPQAAAQSRVSSQGKLAQTIQGLYPNANVEVTEENGRIVVSGEVSSNDEAFKILALVRRVRLVPVVDRLRVR